MKIEALIAAIEAFAPPEIQEDYDNSGLITGMTSWECTGAICALDVTTEVIDEAVRKNCNLLIVHHPIIFTGLKTITGKTYVEEIIIKALKNDIAIYAAHTNLDNVLLGVSGRMATMLGIKNAAVLQPKKKVLRRLITFAPLDKAKEVRQAIFDAGAGHIGNYSECSFNSKGTGTFKAEKGSDPYIGEIGKRHEEEETKIEVVYPAYLELQIVKALIDSHPYEEVAYDIFTMDNMYYGIGAGVIGEIKEPMPEEAFLNELKRIFKTGIIRHTALSGKTIKKVALCGGAGSFLINTALRAGADIFVTGDMKYHDFFESNRKMLVADIGHYESEQFSVDLLHELLVKKFPTFAVLKTEMNTNPVNYFV